jgi:hypothetical protein
MCSNNLTSRRIDMLTINDLHQEQELSASRMGKVAGGLTCDQVKEGADVLTAASMAFRAAGLTDAANYLVDTANVWIMGLPDPTCS